MTEHKSFQIALYVAGSLFALALIILFYKPVVSLETKGDCIVKTTADRNIDGSGKTVKVEYCHG